MKTLGILGGMGPMAGAYFYSRVIANTDSDGDSGHLPVVLFADPHTPDRSAHLVSGGVDPLPWLVSGIEALQVMGAKVVAIPCNTAHAYLSRMPSFSLSLMDMPYLAVAEASGRGAHRVGLLSTRGTVSSGVYRRAAEGLSAELLTLPRDLNASLEVLIYRQKGGEMLSFEEYLPYVKHLLNIGADTVILGCTEISVAFSGFSFPSVIDALEVLAREAVKLCGGNLREEGARNDIRRAAM